MTSFLGIVLFSLLLSLPTSVAGQKIVRCERVDESAKTAWGWIREHNPTDGGLVKKLAGRVVLPDASILAGALVELFDHPELAIEKRNRLAACQTTYKGEFRFKGIPPGRYEVRASYLHGGFDAGQTIVTLAPTNQAASRKQILVRLEVSQ